MAQGTISAVIRSAKREITEREVASLWLLGFMVSLIGAVAFADYAADQWKVGGWLAAIFFVAFTVLLLLLMGGFAEEVAIRMGIADREEQR
jgi:predicted membrane channel-forming protein YqfA (hemolysin III family)